MQQPLKYCPDTLISEGDSRLRLYLFLVAEAIGIDARDCALITYLGTPPLECCTFRFPGGSATGTFLQIATAFVGVDSLQELIDSLCEGGILDSSS
jgi:hypothetical protein